MGFWGDYRQPAFAADSRGNRLAKCELVTVHGEERAWMLLCASEDTVKQLRLLWPEAVLEQVDPDEAQDYTHRLVFHNGLPAEAETVLELLTNVLSLPAPRSVDCMVALDFYKAPQDGKAPEEWPETEVGQWIRYTKYAPFPNGSNSRRCYALLKERLADFIIRHPLFSEAETIIAPPGHAADGRSYAERLAFSVATATGKHYIPSSTPAARPEQKGNLHQNLDSAFNLAETVDGTVIIIDDVYRTGATITGEAAAARRAGASQVLGLTAARTMRN